MNKMKKLLSVLLAVVIALSCMSISASAVKAEYQTVDELTALGAYSPYGQVTRLSTEERMSMVFDFLDVTLGGLGIKMEINAFVTTINIDLTSVNGLCSTIDEFRGILEMFIVGDIVKGLLGDLKGLELGDWTTGMSRDATEISKHSKVNLFIGYEIIDLLNDNSGVFKTIVSNGDLNLGTIGSLAGLNLNLKPILGDLPGLIKGLIFPMFERWDDTLTEIKTLDGNMKGNGNVVSTLNTFVKNLFNNDMSITTLKYDVNGNMTSEHTNWKNTVTGAAEPGTPSNDSPRCYYQFTSTTPGSVMTVYHIVDAKEAEALAKTPDEINGSPAAYTYFKEKQTFVMSQEVEGSNTYVWKATDEYDNTWSLKWYNDDSQFLPGFSGNNVDITTMSASELLYTFVKPVFSNMAPVVLNGSVKKALADFLGADFTYVGSVAKDSKDIAAVKALADYNVNNEGKVNNIFTMPQGDYLWEWSYYEIINGNHYYRFQDQIFVGDTTSKNNYFDIINWDYEITGDFMDEFLPKSNNGKGSSTETLLMNLNNFIVKVADTALKSSASTEDAISGFKAQWTRPNLEELKGGNDKLVNTLKTLAQEVIGLAPQHVFGSDYATNERCYVELMLANHTSTGTDNKGNTVTIKGSVVGEAVENDVILTGIAAHLVNMLMPSMLLPGKSDIVESNAKVGAILAAVVRELITQLLPQNNYDNLIYADYGTSTSDKVKTFVPGKDNSYWLDVIMTMGIDLGIEYLHNLADFYGDTAALSANNTLWHYNYTWAAGTTQQDLEDYWENMLYYVVNWALAADSEGNSCVWNMSNLVNYSKDATKPTDPWVILGSVIKNLLPIDQILNIDTSDAFWLETLLRDKLVLSLLNLEWKNVTDLLIVPETSTLRTEPVLSALTVIIRDLVNTILYKAGGNTNLFDTDTFKSLDNLANQANIANLVPVILQMLWNAAENTMNGAGLFDTVLPIVNFFLGWTTNPQKMAEPNITMTYRDGVDYMFVWTGSDGKSKAIEETTLSIRNMSAGMLEKHRGSSTTDHAYVIRIESITSDATKNTLNFNYTAGQEIQPYGSADIAVTGTYGGDEAIAITVAYSYIGKDGEPVGDTQYKVFYTFISSLYSDSRISGRVSGQDDKDYYGIGDFMAYVFTNNIYNAVTEYKATIMQTGTITRELKFSSITAPDQNIKMNSLASDYFAYITDQTEAGWDTIVNKKSGGSSSGKLFKAKTGITSETDFPTGVYDMGQYAVKYGNKKTIGSGYNAGSSKTVQVDFIHYDDMGIDGVLSDYAAKNITINDVKGDDAVAAFNAYNTALKAVARLALYPFMTTQNSATAAAHDYLTAIMPDIEGAIKTLEEKYKALEVYLADATASAEMPSTVKALEDLLKTDDGLDENNRPSETEVEINYQNYDLYEYFQYADLRTEARNLVKSYYAPEVMDQYYILNSGIRQAELDKVIAAESNPFIAAGITASRLENDKGAVSASIEANKEWKAPIHTKLFLEDMKARLEYYKGFLNDTVKETRVIQFLEKEINYAEAQQYKQADYTADTWEAYTVALAYAKDVKDSKVTHSDLNSVIFNAKWKLMVAQKQLLLKKESLIEAGGTAELKANIITAEAIFTSLAAGDGAWALKEGVKADEAYAQLISALGYYYTGEDGNEWNLYADSAYEYQDNDRPNNQGNQAKVNASNAALVAAIGNFEAKATEPNTLVLNENAPFEAIIDTVNCGEYTGAIYGFDTLGWNDDLAVDGTIADFVTTAYGDDYLEVVVGEAGVETTGTLINVLDAEGNVVETYVYIYFGDIDMDGLVGASDGGIATDYEMYYVGFETLDTFMAGDLDGDALPGASDGGFMADFEMYYVGLPYQVDVGAVAKEIAYEIY